MDGIYWETSEVPGIVFIGWWIWWFSTTPSDSRGWTFSFIPCLGTCSLPDFLRLGCDPAGLRFGPPPAQDPPPDPAGLPLGGLFSGPCRMGSFFSGSVVISEALALRRHRKALRVSSVELFGIRELKALVMHPCGAFAPC